MMILDGVQNDFFFQTIAPTEQRTLSELDFRTRSARDINSLSTKHFSLNLAKSVLNFQKLHLAWKNKPR
jgi:hypothetical protein